MHRFSVVSKAIDTVLVYRWDEWVPLNRLLAYNEENNKQKALQQSAAASGALSAAKTHATRKGTTGIGTREGGAGTRGSRKDGTRGTKRGREEVTFFPRFLLFSQSRITG